MQSDGISEEEARVGNQGTMAALGSVRLKSGRKHCTLLIRI